LLSDYAVAAEVVINLITSDFSILLFRKMSMQVSLRNVFINVTTNFLRVRKKFRTLFRNLVSRKKAFYSAGGIF